MHVAHFTYGMGVRRYIFGGETLSLEMRVRKLEDWSTRWEERLDLHLKMCDRRGARLEKLGWWIGGFVLTTMVSSVGTLIWLLLRPVLKLGGG